ncbi:hypothetical protein ACFRNT_11260 [Streptomyces sp. NPDC056697]|uniref:hypothetical protein n=1 Tax=Streptomyces sp. NPDC056697 TaxID=3345915 RepID=UPI0036CEB828
MTADEIRAIVREELREALTVLAAQADAFPGYETDTVEDTAAHMLSRVTENAAEALRHASTCKTRTGSRYYWDCDCGAREERR